MTGRAARGPQAKTAAQMLGHPFGLGLVLGVVFFAGLWLSGALRSTAVDRVEREPVPEPGIRPAVEPSAPADLRAPGVPVPATPVPKEVPGETRPALSPDVEDVAFLKLRKLLLPVQAVDPKSLRDDFADARTGHSHEALDILAPRGSAVVAVDDGVVQKLFTSVRGGLTVYQFDPEGTYCYYYAHLDRYAPGLREGMALKKGDRIGDVGTTGNAPPQTPHLHFAIFKLGPEKQWWKGAALNPYPLWGSAPARAD
ncbi:MAG: M23 family metallopeptidase [Vicinamibacteria bacterium]